MSSFLVDIHHLLFFFFEESAPVTRMTTAMATKEEKDTTTTSPTMPPTTTYPDYEYYDWTPSEPELIDCQYEGIVGLHRPQPLTIPLMITQQQKINDASATRRNGS